VVFFPRPDLARTSHRQPLLFLIDSRSPTSTYSITYRSLLRQGACSFIRGIDFLALWPLIVFLPLHHLNAGLWLLWWKVGSPSLFSLLANELFLFPSRFIYQAFGSLTFRRYLTPDRPEVVRCSPLSSPFLLAPSIFFSSFPFEYSRRGWVLIGEIGDPRCFLHRIPPLYYDVPPPFS